MSLRPDLPPGRAPRAVEVTPKGAQRSGAPRRCAVDGASTAVHSKTRATARRRSAGLPPRNVLDYWWGVPPSGHVWGFARFHIDDRERAPIRTTAPEKFPSYVCAAATVENPRAANITARPRFTVLLSNLIDFMFHSPFRNSWEDRGLDHVDCPSSDDLRHFVGFRDGGSGSLVVEVMRRAVGAASDDLRSSGV